MSFLSNDAGTEGTEAQANLHHCTLRHRMSIFFWPIIALCAALGATALWLAFRLLIMWITLD